MEEHAAQKIFIEFTSGSQVAYGKGDMKWGQFVHMSEYESNVLITILSRQRKIAAYTAEGLRKT